MRKSQNLWYVIEPAAADSLLFIVQSIYSLVQFLSQQEIFSLVPRATAEKETQVSAVSATSVDSEPPAKRIRKDEDRKWAAEEDGRFKCPWCGDCFSKRKNLYQHLERQVAKESLLAIAKSNNNESECQDCISPNFISLLT